MNQAMKSLELVLNPPEPPPAAPGGPLALPSAHPSNNSNPDPLGDKPKRVPALTDKGKQYKEAIFAGLGRGKAWDEVAHKLIERNPSDRQDIQVACLHILLEAR
jgi:hypothetical protein